jgi:uncharacterized membrane protein YfcA
VKKRIAFEAIESLPPMDKIKAIVALVFSGLVAIAFVVSLIAMLWFKGHDPTSDITLWVNVFLTCLGYVVGILSGLFGIPVASVAPKP